jgi:AcrR family transcriptional regulator
MPRTKRLPTSPEIARDGSGEDSRRIARRERRRDRSREEILEAARRVLFRVGVSATTLEAVAKEVGVSKAALYYYYPSKDALLFELIFGALETHAHAVHLAVEEAGDGAEALGALVREAVQAFAPRLENFRLAFLHGQVANPGSIHFDAQQFARIRPLNDLWLAGATAKLAAEQRQFASRARVEPRLMAFLAYLAAIGILTMKGMVESLDDPLVYSDDQLIEGFARIFAAAAAPDQP